MSQLNEEKREELIEGLRKSRRLLGPIYPIIVKRGTLEIIDGKHRKQVDPTWPEKEVEFLDKKSELLFRMHSNYRRQVSRKETQTQLLMIADILEEKEGVPREQIASKLAEITPYSIVWIEKLLPKKYKEPKFIPKKTSLGRPPKDMYKNVRIPSNTSEIRKSEDAKPSVGFESKIPEPAAEKLGIDKDVASGRVSESVKWILNVSVDDVNYRTTVPRLTDAELEYCLQHETRTGGRQQLEREFRQRTGDLTQPLQVRQPIQTETPTPSSIKSPVPRTVACPYCHVDLQVVLCSKCWRDLKVKDLFKEALKDVRS